MPELQLAQQQQQLAAAAGPREPGIDDDEPAPPPDLAWRVVCQVGVDRSGWRNQRMPFPCAASQGRVAVPVGSLDTLQVRQGQGGRIGRRE